MLRYPDTKGESAERAASHKDFHHRAMPDVHSDADYTAMPSGDGAPRDRKVLLAACIAVYLVQYSQSQAMIAPFIAASAPGALIGPDLVGIAFSAYPLATAAATPLPPRALRRFGLRGMVVLGLLMSSLGNLAFGFAGTLCHSMHVGVLAASLICARAVGGIGAALSEAGCLTAVTTAGWGDDLGKVLSMIEVTTGLGAAFGAAAGGWLYSVGGFALPMGMGTLLPLCVLPAVIRILSSDDAGAAAAAAADAEDPMSPSARARRLALGGARWATCAS